MSKNGHTIHLPDTTRGKLLSLIADYAEGAEHNWLYAVAQVRPLVLSDLALQELFALMNKASNALRRHPAGSLTDDLEALRLNLRHLITHRPVASQAELRRAR